MTADDVVIDVAAYRAHIGVGLLSRAAPIVADVVAPSSTSTVVVLVDAGVPPGSWDALAAGLRLLYNRVIVHVLSTLPNGEQCKTRDVKAGLEDFLLANECGRDTALVIVGGGTVGDLCAFVAATYMRGIPYIHVPTTLLAMVDSSIGGKTGVNTPRGKNLIGAFHQPRAVLCDPAVLSSLPDRHVSNGMAEVIKSGAIFSSSLFAACEERSAQIMAKDMRWLTTVIVESVAIKARVVINDERESGMRSSLNFGHSIGHGIESVTGMLHGQAVAIGMVAEARLTSATIAQRIADCVSLYALPTSIPEGVDMRAVLQRMSVDKKNAGGRKRVVLLDTIGRVRSEPSWTTAVTDEEIRLAVVGHDGFIVSRSSAPLCGAVRVPGSKSVSNRALILAALGSGRCKLNGMLFSEDTRVLINCLRALGVVIAISEDGSVLVTGSSGRLSEPSAPLFVANAGTAARFLTAALSLLPVGTSAVLTGSSRMHERPCADLIDSLTKHCSVRIDCLGRPGCLPIRVHGRGGFPGGPVRLDASVSSQFASAVLLAAPFAAVPVKLVLGADTVSRDYITLTVAMMQAFGASCSTASSNEYDVEATGAYANPSEYDIEGDASSATYPLALAAVTGGTVTVRNVGSSSSQGDARFAVNVLEAMGCKVEQTRDSTTVTGPTGPLQAIDIDMGPMTDAFITLVACAAVAQGRTFIRGIANQRVKECNRIAACVSQLALLGVPAGELPDGLWVDGRPGLRVSGPPARIACFKDHRIAMAFTVLGARTGSVVITDPLCVNKTYPSFWDDVRLQLHGTVSASEPERRVESNIVYLIGMRGSGKTRLGRNAADRLGYQFVDLDAEIEKRCSATAAEYVERNGWPAFRSMELEVLRDVTFGKPMVDPSAKAIVSCGGGIVESPEAVALLGTRSNVVEIRRALRDLKADLEADKTRAVLPDSADDTWARRRPLFEAASRTEFYIGAGDRDWDRLGGELAHLIARLGRGDDQVGDERRSPFMLCLTCRDILGLPPGRLGAICEMADVVELRLDYLDAKDDPDSVREQWAALRLALGHQPVIWTARSVGEGGRVAHDVAFKLLKLGARLGVEYLDVEASLPAAARADVLDSVTKATRVIGSLHSSRSEVNEEMFTAAELDGRADVVKVVTTARTVDDALDIVQHARRYRSRRANTICIALAMGDAGRLSRALNPAFTPVTHPDLSPSAPGQVSLAALNALRYAIGAIAVRQFYLFGGPSIVSSPSPALHNQAFALCGLPYSYAAAVSETGHVTDDIRRIIKDDSFGGASVTIPLKEAIIDVLDGTTAIAGRIGAVNTIIRDPEDAARRIGDNTDWIGVRDCLQPHLRPGRRAAVVIGAGGTAKAALFALEQLGFDLGRVHLHNRTVERAHAIATVFGCRVLSDLDRDVVPDVDVIINTVPGHVAMTVPERYLQDCPLVLDANYARDGTALMKQAESHGCTVVSGQAMLLYQGAAQFAVWTGMRPPVTVMRNAVQQFLAAKPTH
ncbi:unnamed protein product (mitochondrion) [Plasmodiophora brassicae]|uniref:Pentafunctional AROM polypeptide n=1 Tax=Plasmodiophora brassicae TaxID=37360 RepID=A0A3P3Y0S8_PLABS|nr:unnamed protein product [Plasmodiophora brassicae]